MKKLAFLLVLLSVLMSPLVFLREWLSYLGLLPEAYSVGSLHRTSDTLLVVREGLPILFLLSIALSRRSFWKDRRLIPIVWLALLLLASLSVNLLVQPYSVV